MQMDAAARIVQVVCVTFVAAAFVIFKIHSWRNCVLKIYSSVRRAFCTYHHKPGCALSRSPRYCGLSFLSWTVIAVRIARVTLVPAKGEMRRMDCVTCGTNLARHW